MKLAPSIQTRYPELAFFADERTGRAVLKSCRQRLYRTPRCWIYGLAWLLSGAILGIVFPRLQVPLIGTHLPLWSGSGVAGIILSTAFLIGFQYLWRRPIQRMLRQELAARGVPICIRCGYDLRGQTEPRCPECGAGFDSSLLRQ